MKSLIHNFIGLLLGTMLGGGRLNGKIIHHTGSMVGNDRASTKHHTADIINAGHRARWNGESLSSLGYYGGYTYFIDSEGIVTQFRGVYEQGWHTRGYNFNYVGICLAGNGDVESFSPKCIASLKTLIQELNTDYPELKGKIAPHRKYSRKSCPGNRYTDGWIHALEKMEPTDTVEKQVEMVKLLQIILNLLRQQLELLYIKTS